MTRIATGLARPWYREPWPWLLMLPPLLSILGGVTMVYLATHEPAVLVVADYARIEALTSERRARDAQAAALGLRAQLSFAQLPDGRVRVLLVPGPDGMSWPDELRLRLQHVARDASDRALVLTRHEGLYATVVQLAAGRYEIEVLPPDGAWRLGGTFTRVPADLQLGPGALEDR